MPWEIIALPALLSLVIGFLNGKKAKEKLKHSSEKTRLHEK